MGHRFSVQGIKVDESKIKAITEMEKPKNAKNLESFLGMITCLSLYTRCMYHR